MVRFHYDGFWYTVQPAEKGCKDCSFEGQRHAVCKAAGEAAAEAGVPDCESRPGVHSGNIYRLDLSSGRQQDFFFKDVLNPTKNVVTARKDHGQKIPVEA